MKISWKTVAPLGIWLAIYLVPVPAGLNASQWHYFAVFAAVIAGLILESMPVGAVGLIGLTVAGVSGYVESDPNKSLRWMLGGFSESTVWLIVGAFVFSIGYRKSGLGRRLALMLVRGLGRHTIGLGYAVAFSDLVLAPATPSNTARSGGTIYPIVSNIPRIYGSEPGPTAGKIGTFVMWTAFATTAVTSSLFLTALAPNAAALSIAKKIVGVDIGWSQWFAGFAPLGIPLLLLVPLLSYVVCRPQVKQSPEIVTWSASELAAMGPPSRHEWIMAALVLLAMFLWITGSNPTITLPVLGSNFINPTMVVFVVISLMLVTGVIEFEDIVAERSAWEVFFYFTSLLTLSSGLNEIGFIKWVAEGYAKPLATMSPTLGMILLVSFFFWNPLARGGGVARGARRRHQHSRIVDPDADVALRLLAGIDGRDLALCNRSGADVFRQRLYRQSRFLEIRPDLRGDLLCGSSRDRAAVAAADRRLVSQGTHAHSERA